KVQDGRISSVTILRPSAEENKPSLELVECFFSEGQHAVTLSGPVSVKCSHCAFAPQTLSVFDIRRTNVREDNEKATLTMVNGSSFVSEGSAFRLDQGALCRLDVRESVFSSPDQDPPGRGGALIEQAGEGPVELDYA